MGSFNETCALSGLHIVCGCPVKLLFLTRCPYVDSDQKYFTRGCYSYDHWFQRNLPISGVYNDYGKCDFSKNIITDTVEDIFNIDVFEQPFGFNVYHAPPVRKGFNIHQILDAAFEGRLKVYDGYKNDTDDDLFDWKKVESCIISQGLKIMQNTNDAAYKVQQVCNGIVCVEFNGSGSKRSKLEKLKRKLSEFDCVIVSEREEDSQHGPGNYLLLVMPKGSIEKPENLLNIEEIKLKMSSYPEKCRTNVTLPVMSVMVRQDIWDLYKNVDCDHLGLDMVDIKSKINDTRLLGYSLPFQNDFVAHYDYIVKHRTVDDDVINVFIESIRVNYIMSLLGQSWEVPILGGQDPELELRLKMNKKIGKIIQSEIDECKEYE